jgi:dethiobiotin synthetase
MQSVFISGIDTNVGKTIVSAILMQKLGWTYWKPVQTGDDRDLTTVKSLVSNPQAKYLPERFLLKKPASPHTAAEEEGVFIHEHDIVLPQATGNLIIEGAGGIMVPINNQGLTFLQMVKKWQSEVVLVSRNYLGSINHTLLTVRVLQQEGIPIKGIVFNGEPNISGERIIERITDLPILLRIKNETVFSAELINSYSNQMEW